MTGTDITTLVERLREHQCGCGGACGQQTPAYIAEAADALEACQAENERLRKALAGMKDRRELAVEVEYGKLQGWRP